MKDTAGSIVEYAARILSDWEPEQLKAHGLDTLHAKVCAYLGESLNLAEARIAAESWSGAIVAITDYYRWRLRGGVEPPGGDQRAETLTDALTDGLEAQANA